MKSIIRLLAISMLMLFAAPAWSGAAVHIYHCVQEDKGSDEELEAIASEWLAAARKLKGGANLEMFVYFPVAVEQGENDFNLMLITPSFTEMGEFIDAYAGSPLEEIDDRFDELASCANSSMWEGIEIE
jgi:hypothetical protein